MTFRPLAAFCAFVALSLPVAAALAQFTGPPRRPRPSPPPPVVSVPAPAPVQSAPAQTAAPVSQPAAAQDFSLPPPPSDPPVTPTVVAPVEPPFRLGRGDKIVRFRADSPNAAITGISDLGRPLPTRGLGSALVEVLLKADPDEGYGTPCDTEGYVVTLSNGLIWSPKANFCNSGDVVSVPSARTALPRSLPAPLQDFVWQFNKAGLEATLHYGIPETDATAFMASCNKGSTRIDTKFVGEAGAQPRIDVYGPSTLLRYDLTPNQPASDEEPKLNASDLSVDDPLWALLRQGLNLPIRLGNDPLVVFDTSADRARIGQFVTWCGG